MIATHSDFSLAIQQQFSTLLPVQVEKASQFAVLLHRENEIQNLTRILGVKDFVHGHLHDVVELFSLSSLGERVVDLGSGSGVPGLLAAAIDLNPQRKWILVESETNKARFLSEAALTLQLNNVLVVPKRIEIIIQSLEPDTVVARAVGTVEKIAGWISNCSTWNNLILFKSKGWKEEWLAAETSKFGKKLTIIHVHEYSSQNKFRLLITLKRKLI